MPVPEMIAPARDQPWSELSAVLGRFIGRRVQGAERDDVLQETLLRVQRGLPELRESVRFGPWVFQVARSAIVDHHRKTRRHELPDDAEVPEPDAADDALQADLGACLAIFVTRLPSPYREAITLTELEGLTQREAAEMLEISVSGLKSRVQRGRQKLKAMFERCCAMTQDTRGRVISCERR
jgi:RNA polymerase sigma-70 factor (ECF subfamily)